MFRITKTDFLSSVYHYLYPSSLLSCPCLLLLFFFLAPSLFVSCIFLVCLYCMLVHLVTSSPSVSPYPRMFLIQETPFRIFIILYFSGQSSIMAFNRDFQPYISANAQMETRQTSNVP
jgi:hypothetical protein